MEGVRPPVFGMLLFSTPNMAIDMDTKSANLFTFNCLNP